ncbi:MAG TPA: MATE family efflux transporter [Flavisolibacter sp.]|jgi:putative MATE family efflux protein
MTQGLQVQISYRQIWKIALPISLALLVPQINLIINNIFLGHLSEEALAIASITGVYYLIFAGVGFGLNNGLQALISRRAGENRPEEIGKLFGQGILVSMSIAAVGILFTLLVAPAVFRLTLPAATYEPVISFLNIRIFGLLFLYVYQMRNALLVGINQSRYLVAGTLAEAAANIFFDYVLIYGALGFPALGFNGAAVASLIAEFTGMFVIYLVLHAKGITRTYSLFSRIRFNRPVTGQILKLSGPLIFQHGISVLSWFFFYMLIARNASQTGLAISTTMRTIFAFFGVLIWAFASTTNSMVSNVIGQGRREEVLLLIGKIARLSFAVSVLVCLTLNIFPGFYLSLFRADERFITEGIPVVRLVSFTILLVSQGSIWLNAVTGTGNSRMTFLIELVAIVFYGIYVYVVLEVEQMSVFWGWASELMYWGLLYVMSLWYVRSKRWYSTVI